MSPGDAVVEFVRSFNERDLDAFVAILDPEVELHSRRGLIKGIPAARDWATRAPGGVQQTVVVTELEVVDQRALAKIRRDWHWYEDGSFAGSDELFWFFRFRDDRIVSWRPFDDTAEAFAEFTAS